MAPKTAHEAARILADHAPGEAMVMAGGTDLLPNMKRRQQTPKVLVSLAHVDELRHASNGSGMVLGAGLTLSQLATDPRIRQHYAAYQAASQIATPPLRNMGTLGGNICLDTRCNYYDQNYEWRQAIGFCMKKEGTVCWVAPSSDHCLAVSSTDTAPMLIALGANVAFVSKKDGPRELALTPRPNTETTSPGAREVFFGLLPGAADTVSEGPRSVDHRAAQCGRMPRATMITPSTMPPHGRWRRTMLAPRPSASP